MKTLLFLISISFVLPLNAADSYPHEVFLDCTVKLQRMGISKELSDHSCSVSAGPECSLMKSFVIQSSFPNCVGDLLYLGVEPKEKSLQYCLMAPKKSVQCIPQNYIVEREEFVECVAKGYSLDSCLNRESSL